MGVQVPPFALIITSVLIVLAGLVSCRGDADRIHDEQVYHLQQLSTILAAHPGRTDEIVKDLSKYVLDNEKRLLDARRDRGRLLDRLSPAEKEAFAKESVERTRTLRDNVRTAIGACSEPEKIMHWARQLFL